MRLTDEEREALRRAYIRWQNTPLDDDQADECASLVIAALATVPRLAASAPGVEREVCRWSYYDWPESDSDFEGDCGILWCFSDGGLGENGVVFCPRCGGRIAFVPPVEDDDDEDDPALSPAPAPTEGREP